MSKKYLLNKFVSTQQSENCDTSSATEGSSTSLVFRMNENKWIRPTSSDDTSTTDKAIIYDQSKSPKILKIIIPGNLNYFILFIL